MLDKILNPSRARNDAAQAAIHERVDSINMAQADVLRRLIRIETRLCTLLEAMNVDPRGAAHYEQRRG